MTGEATMQNHEYGRMDERVVNKTRFYHINGHLRAEIKGKSLPQQAEVAQGVPGRLRPRIFLTFSTTRVVGRQPYVPATFTPEKIPGTHF